MKILTGQKFGLAFFQPLRSGQGLALGAMPIGARVVCVSFVAALVTLFQMTAERHSSIERSTRFCCVDREAACAWRNSSPWTRTISATSRAGRMERRPRILNQRRAAEADPRGW